MLKKIILLNVALLFLFYSLLGMEEQSLKQDNKLQLIVLNGASCAGKSSLARALIKQACQKGTSRVYHMSFDDFCVNVATQEHYISEQKEYLESKGKIIFADPRVNASERERQQYFLIFYEKILEKIEKKKKAKEGAIIITDICFSTPESFLDFLKTFQSYQKDIALIKVFCSYDIARKRLEERNKSIDYTQHRVEWCFEQHYKQPKFSTIYDSKEYDAGINTSHIFPFIAAEKLSYLFDGINEKAFDTNYKKHSDAIANRYNPDVCILQ